MHYRNLYYLYKVSCRIHVNQIIKRLRDTEEGNVFIFQCILCMFSPLFPYKEKTQCRIMNIHMSIDSI